MKIWTCGSSAKWVPKSLNVDQKRQRCQSSEQLLEFFRCDPNDFLSRLVAMDETCLYHYDPETKQQSVEWWHNGSPHPQKIRLQKSAGKDLASIFWNQDGVLFIDYLPKGPTINAEYYSSVLVQLKDILKEKRRGKFTRGVFVLARHCPGSPDTYNPEETDLPGFRMSITRPILRIWPRRTTTCSLD